MRAPLGLVLLQLRDESEQRAGGGGDPDHSKRPQQRLMSEPGLLTSITFHYFLLKVKAGSSSGCLGRTGGPPASLMGTALTARVPLVCPQYLS